jgi:hypothetical protein
VTSKDSFNALERNGQDENGSGVFMFRYARPRAAGSAVKSAVKKSPNPLTRQGLF